MIGDLSPSPHWAARLAVVSAPRSGNTWFRSVMASAMNASQYAAHNYCDFPQLDNRAVIQIHWYREPNFQRFLRGQDCRVAVIARHPLDVLMSICHFIIHEPETARWLDGNAEIPANLPGKGPCSPEFIDYALGWGFENVLSVTYQWWHDADALRLRYEDMVRDPVLEMGRAGALFSVPSYRLVGALNHNPFKRFRNTANYHGWHGTPGLWRRLIPADVCASIYRRHVRMFDALGYSDCISTIDHDEAQANWNLLRRSTDR